MDKLLRRRIKNKQKKEIKTVWKTTIWVLCCLNNVASTTFSSHRPLNETDYIQSTSDMLEDLLRLHLVSPCVTFNTVDFSSRYIVDNIVARMELQTVVTTTEISHRIMAHNTDHTYVNECACYVVIGDCSSGVPDVLRSRILRKAQNVLFVITRSEKNFVQSVNFPPSMSHVVFAIQEVKSSVFRFYGIINNELLHIGIWKKELFLFSDFVFEANYLNMYGRNLNVSVAPFFPFTVISDEQTPNQETLIGTEVKLLNELARRYNFKWEATFPKEKWGDSFPNGTATGVIGDVVNGNTEIGFGGYFIEHDELEIVDFTVPHRILCLTFLTPREIIDPMWSIVLPFEFEMWICICGFYIFSALLLYMFAYLHRRILNRLSRHVKVQECFLDAFSLQFEVSLKLPSRKLKVLITFISITYLLLGSCYKSKLVSFLTSSLLTPQIGTLEALADSQFMICSPQTYIFLMLSLNKDDVSKKLVEKFVIASDPELKKLASSSKFAVFTSYLDSGFAGLVDYLSDDTLSNLDLMQECAFKVGVVFLLLKDSHFKTFFDDAICQVIESGLLYHWEQSLLAQDIRKQRKLLSRNLFDFDNTAKVIKISHLKGAFLILLLGIGLSLPVFLWEIGTSYKRKKKQVRPIRRKKRMNTL